MRGNTSLPWGDWIVPDYRHWHCLLPAWKWQELLLIACLPPPGTSLVSLCKKWVIIGFPVVIKYYHCSLWNSVKRDNKRLKGLEADLVLMLLKVCLLLNLLYVHQTFWEIHFLSLHSAEATWNILETSEKHEHEKTLQPIMILTGVLPGGWVNGFFFMNDSFPACCCFVITCQTCIHLAIVVLKQITTYLVDNYEINK